MNVMVKLHQVEGVVVDRLTPRGTSEPQAILILKEKDGAHVDVPIDEAGISVLRRALDDLEQAIRMKRAGLVTQ